MAASSQALGQNASAVAQDASVVGQDPGAIGQFCGQIFSLEHFIKLDDGTTLHVIERFSGKALLRHPRRAILMLPATLVTSALYDAQIPGDDSYNAMDRAAREGFFAFSVDYEGYGQSSLPADGKTVTFDRMLGHQGQILEWIRHTRHVRKVDILGTSIGSDLAVALGGVESPIDRDDVGRVLLTAYVYKNFTEFVKENAFTPAFQAFLESVPNGYVQTTPQIYALVLTAVQDPALSWAYATFPGVYAVGPTLEGFRLPTQEGSLGRAPAMEFYGDADPVTSYSDVQQFLNEYGGPAQLVVIPGGGHSSFLEPGRNIFWSNALEFLRAEDHHHEFSVCDLAAAFNHPADHHHS